MVEYHARENNLSLEEMIDEIIEQAWRLAMVNIIIQSKSS